MLARTREGIAIVLADRRLGATFCYGGRVSAAGPRARKKYSMNNFLYNFYINWLYNPFISLTQSLAKNPDGLYILGGIFIVLLITFTALDFW